MRRLTFSILWVVVTGALTAWLVYHHHNTNEIWPKARSAPYEWELK